VSTEQDWRMDARRARIEHEALQKYIKGIHEDDLLEAMHRWVIDLLDSGHTPSQHMLQMISGELKAKWWPVPETKQRRHSKERAWLLAEQCLLHYSMNKYRTKERPPKKTIEADIAKNYGISRAKLLKDRARFRQRVKKHEAERERQRTRPLRKRERK